MKPFSLFPQEKRCRPSGAEGAAGFFPLRRRVGILLVLLAGLIRADGATLTVTAVNKLSRTRPRQTLELTAAQLAPLGAKNLNSVHVRDLSGKEILCQAVDTDLDEYHKPDLVIFQADFAPHESKQFSVAVGPKQEFTKDQFQAYGRFVRERFDDFAWENDRIAHRMYGKALETWAGEPLTSSTVDIWSKRTPRLVINDWYMTDDYHKDHGEGADFYSAGPSRGCGGSGFWEGGRLWTSRNFTNSRVLANGPIRILFELEYEPFEVNGKRVREVKRISLDAGSQLDHFQSLYEWAGPAGSSSQTVGIGIKKVPGATRSLDSAKGTLVDWEKMEKNAGMQGIAVLVEPEAVAGEAEDKLNHLLLAKCPGASLSYWAGFCWDKAGQITSPEAWRQYVDAFAQGLASPIAVTVTGK